MEQLEHSTAAGLSVLLRPRVGGSVAARGGRATAAGSGQATPSSPSPSMLSAAVREMLAAQRLKPVAKKPRRPCLTPRPSSGASQRSCSPKAGVAVAPAERAAAVLPTARMRHALAKRVARRMLRRRGASPPAPDHHGGTKVVMTCCCERLPPGLRCGGGGGARGWAFGEYARWRRSVWAPSRFYVERVSLDGREERVDRAPPRPALLVERTAKCAGVSVRRFLLVADGDPEHSGSEMGLCASA